MAARRGCGLWHAFCTAINCPARRKRMSWLPANSARCSNPPHRGCFASSRQGVLFLLACTGNPRCTKACQSPQPRSLSRPRAGFLHGLRLSTLCPGAAPNPHRVHPHLSASVRARSCPWVGGGGLRSELVLGGLQVALALRMHSGALQGFICLCLLWPHNRRYGPRRVPSRRIARPRCSPA